MMYQPNPVKPMAIGTGKHLEATGIIKKVFPHKPDPYGFMLLLTPLELRGQEASFFCSDLKVPDEEKGHLRVGMQLKFHVIDKPLDNMRSPVDYKAIEISPLTPAYYQAAVVRPPNASGRLRVAVDLTLEQVNITPASYLKLGLAKPMKEGDPCVIQLTWKELIEATKANTLLEGEIVSACRLRLPMSGSQDATVTGTEETAPPGEDSTPEKTKPSPSGGKSTPKKVKQPMVRSRPQTPTTPKLLNPFNADYSCNGSKQDCRRCYAPCCQDQCFLTPKMPPFPLPTINGACPCAGCLVIRQNYAMISPGHLPCYPMDVGNPSWSDANGC